MLFLLFVFFFLLLLVMLDLSALFPFPIPCVAEERQKENVRLMESSLTVMKRATVSQMVEREIRSEKAWEGKCKLPVVQKLWW